jgi:hypothetical protein
MKKTSAPASQRNSRRNSLALVESSQKPTIPEFATNLGLTEPRKTLGIILLPMQQAHATNPHTRLAYGADVQQWLNQRHQIPSSVPLWQASHLATPGLLARRQRLEEDLLVAGCRQMNQVPLCVLALDLLERPDALLELEAKVLSSYRRHNIPMLLLSLPAWRRAETTPYSVEKLRQYCQSMTPNLKVDMDVFEEKPAQTH